MGIKIFFRFFTYGFDFFRFFKSVVFCSVSTFFSFANSSILANLLVVFKDGIKFLDFLWSAPEIIRDPFMERNQATDIYSFAIVCSEIINLQPAWQLVNKERSATGELEKN